MRPTTRFRLSRLSIGALGVLVGVAWVPAASPDAPRAEQTQPVLWLAPSSEETAARAGLARAVSDLAENRAAAALPVLEQAAQDPVLGAYAALYAGRATLALERHAEAAAAARALVTSAPTAYLRDAALGLAADAAEGAADWPAVVESMRQYVGARPSAAAWLRLGRAAENASDRALAIESYTRVHYDFPLASEAADAASARARLVDKPISPSRDTFAADLARAERLYSGRRYTDARKAFEPLRALSAGAERLAVDLRIAQCDFFLKRYVAARDALRAYLDHPDAGLANVAEAEFYYLGTLREMGRHDEYVGLVQDFVARHAARPLAEAALNDLGTHYILANEDGKAAAVFAEQYAKYPTGAFADRAAWKAGWWAYKSADYAEAIRIFESAAVTLRRADFRPAWLYWAARSHLQLGHLDVALAGYERVMADYRNSYYGREAAGEAQRVLAQLRPGQAGPATPARRELPATLGSEPPPNAALVKHLLAAGMYDEAIGELRAAARERPSPLIDATIAFALNRKGDLRPAITAMRRAYPQFMADGGEALPREILHVIFPVDYWDLIQRYASARRLDPFLMMALIAQESTFQADVRSVANAYGLMQIVPATGRRYAQTLGIRPFRTMRLTEAETNIRIGMAYFSDLMREFSDVAAALAAYNAGEQRVARWLAERPGVSRDEFIDDIPFPETQNYVKRILGTAEDYRLLYRDRQ